MPIFQRLQGTLLGVEFIPQLRQILLPQRYRRSSWTHLETQIRNSITIRPQLLVVQSLSLSIENSKYPPRFCFLFVHPRSEPNRCRSIVPIQARSPNAPPRTSTHQIDGPIAFRRRRPSNCQSVIWRNTSFRDSRVDRQQVSIIGAFPLLELISRHFSRTTTTPSSTATNLIFVKRDKTIHFRIKITNRLPSLRRQDWFVGRRTAHLELLLIHDPDGVVRVDLMSRDDLVTVRTRGRNQIEVWDRGVRELEPDHLPVVIPDW